MTGPTAGHAPAHARPLPSPPALNASKSYPFTRKEADLQHEGIWMSQRPRRSECSVGKEERFPHVLVVQDNRE